MPFILYSIWHYVGFLHTIRKLLQGGHATVFPFWMKICEWKVWQGGCTTLFPFSIKICISCWGHATSLLFSDRFPISIPSEKGRRVPELCDRRPEILACFSCVARVLLPFVGWKHMGFLLRPNVARPSSPSIARKSDVCLKKEVKWRDLSVRRGFRLKMETRWRDLPAKLFTRGFRL